MSKIFNKHVLLNVWLILVQIPFAVIYFFLGAVAVLALSYFLGHQLLEGIMMGSDTTFVISYLKYFDQFFPRIPFWFPLQGAGQSIVASYYVLPYYITIIIERLSDLSLIQSFRLFEFLTVPLVALEIYFYIWIRLRSQTAALIGALLYPLSSASWAWMTHGGFFAVSASLIFIVPAFLFFDLYLESCIFKDYSVKLKRLWLLLASLFFGIALVSHLSVGASLLLTFFIYALIRPQLAPREGKRIGSVFEGIKALVIVVFFGFLVSSFLFYPQRHYLGFANRNFIPVYGPDVPQIYPKAFLGFEAYPGDFDSIYQPMFLFQAMTLLGILGTIIALFRRHFFAAIGIIAFLLVGYASVSRLISSWGFFFPTLMLPTNIRVVMISFIFMPIMAAYGAWNAAFIPFEILFKVLNYIKVRWIFIKDIIFRSIASILALAFVFYVIFSLRLVQNRPATKENEFAYQGIGPLGLHISFCQFPFWGLNELPLGTTCADLAPGYVISDIGRDALSETNFDKLAKDLDFNQFTRVDVSSHLGLITASLGQHSLVSNIATSHGPGSLIYPMWGYQVANFYLNDGSAKVVDELAKWFGLQYIFLHPDIDPLERYPKTDWPNVGNVGIAEVRRFEKATSMATLELKPQILVIGTPKKGAYERIFKIATAGGIDYENAILVEGKEKIDGYSLQQLKRFDAIFLHGFSYKNRKKALKLLKTYVEEGGSLFIDTGWQFIDRDWGKGPDEKGNYYPIDLPEPFPVKKTQWKSLAKDWREASFDVSFLADVTPEKFASFVGRDGPWGAAYADKNDLLGWAMPVISFGNQIVMAKGTLGKGKVIWSGMNLPAHAYDSKNQDEIRFFANLTSYLVGDKTGQVMDLIAKRDFPDTVDIQLQGIERPTGLLWREPYSPDWKVTLKIDGKEEKLEILPAGPGLMLVQLPPISKEAQVRLDYELWKVAALGSIISLFTLTFLILNLADTWFFDRRVEGKLFGLVRQKIFPITAFFRSKKEEILKSEEG
jgi:hypothetical protein